MADLSNLASALLSQQQQYLTEDPFYAGGVGLQKAMGVLGQEYQGVDPWQKALAAALLGLGGGVMQGLGKARASARSAELGSAFEDYSKAPAEERKGIISNNPELAEIAPLLQLHEVGREQKLAETMAELKLKAAFDRANTKPEFREVGVGGRAKQLAAIDPYTGAVLQNIGEEIPMDRPTVINAGTNNAVSEAAAPLFAQKLAEALGTSADDPRVIAAAKDYRSIGALLRTDNAIDVAQRAEDAAQRKKNESLIFGYETLNDDVVLKPGVVEQYQKKIPAVQQAKELLGQLAEKDPTQVFGNDAQTQAAIGSMLFNSFRVQTGSGAALSKGEEAMINDMKPYLAANDLSGALAAGMKGRDQKQFARTMQSLLQDGIDNELFAIGLKRKTKTLDEYPKMLRDTYGVSNVAPPSQGGAPGGGVPVVPPRMPGETPSAYMQRIKTQ